MTTAGDDRQKAVKEYLERSLSDAGESVGLMLLHLTGHGVEVVVGRRQDGLWSARVAFNSKYCSTDAASRRAAMECVGRVSVVEIVGSTLWVAVAKALATARGDTGWRSL